MKFFPASPAVLPRWIGVWLVCVALVSPAFAAASASRPTPAVEIEALLRSVRQLEGATFIRNGDTHTCQEAESHLRMKWEKQSAKIVTAEKFIELCATGSSLSGKSYQIRFANGQVRDSADFFREELTRLRTASAAK